MGRIVVIGGGFGGLASAARLAKLGHTVTVLDRAPALGGALTPYTADGFTWDAAATTFTMPAVLRDLFRKSGRPIESETDADGLGIDPAPLEVLREHRFVDETSIRLPAGSRRDQIEAFDDLEPGLGEAWARYTDGFAEVWDVLRRHYFEQAWQPAALPREVAALLDSRETLAKRLRASFRDDRPATVAGHGFVAEGHDLRNVPAWMGLVSHLEQLFGAWTIPGGTRRLGSAMTARLVERAVEVRVGVEAADIVVHQGRAVAVRTVDGDLDADAVVCAIDPRRLPVLAPQVTRTLPALPPVVTHLGLDADGAPDLPHEVVLHGDPMLVLRPGGAAPAGAVCWTVHGRGRLGEDLLRILARAGYDLRDRVQVRVERTARELVEAWGGSPHGVLWEGRGTVRRRLGPTTPIPGVYAAGAHATPGSGLAFVGLSAALVAAEIGPA